MVRLSLLILAGGRSRRMGQDKLWMLLDGVPLIERGVRRVLPLAGEVLLSSAFRGDGVRPGEQRPGCHAERVDNSSPAAATDQRSISTRELPGRDSREERLPLHALAEQLTREGVPARIVPDVYPAAGPLAGLHAGLATARCDLLLALAADMPFVNLALIERMASLAEGFDAVSPLLPGPDGGLAWEPLHALYRRSCLPAIEARLAAGERRMLSFFADVRTRAVTREEIAPLDPELRSFFNVNTPEDWLAAQAHC